VNFTQFFQYLETNSIHEIVPEQFEKDMAIFDEDHNGTAIVADVRRVLTAYTNLSESEVQHMIKICSLGHKLDEAQMKAKLEDLKLNPSFDIKKACL